ncbi:MAG: DUF342 domain-containing protein [Phycisphaeraceae bacterium]|nr:MAG: DUF342 domain-containing protein [Phycisphaeraceae bacterium]
MGRENEPRIVIADARMRADLSVPASCDPEALSKPALLAIISDAKVELTRDVHARIDGLDPTVLAKGGEFVLAIGTPPINGEDARVEWLARDEAQDNHDTLHLRTKGLIRVSAGDVLARIHQETQGEDGRDVLGGRVAARGGKPLCLRLLDGVQAGSDGVIRAVCDGILRNDDGAVSVRPYLEIAERIDPAARLIDFDGGVRVVVQPHAGLQFRVTGDLEIVPMVDSCSIECAGSLHAQSGIVARESQRLMVGGSLNAKYLDGVSGAIAGDVSVDREIINCTLTIGGSLLAPSASLVGGVTTVTGVVRLKDLGNEAERRTAIVLGSVPLGQAELEQARAAFAGANASARKLVDEHASLTTFGKGLTPQQKERLTELMFEIAEARAEAMKAQSVVSQLEEKLSVQRTVDVSVSRMIYPRCVIVLDGKKYELTRGIRGPVTLTIDQAGLPIIKSGETSCLLESFLRAARAA